MFMVSLDPFGSMSLIVSLVVEERKGACPATQPRVDLGPGRLGVFDHPALTAGKLQDHRDPLNP